MPPKKSTNTKTVTTSKPKTKGKGKGKVVSKVTKMTGQGKGKGKYSITPTSGKYGVMGLMRRSTCEREKSELISKLETQIGSLQGQIEYLKTRKTPDLPLRERAHFDKLSPFDKYLYAQEKDLPHIERLILMSPEFKKYLDQKNNQKTFAEKYLEDRNIEPKYIQKFINQLDSDDVNDSLLFLKELEESFNEFKKAEVVKKPYIQLIEENPNFDIRKYKYKNDPEIQKEYFNYQIDQWFKEFAPDLYENQKNELKQEILSKLFSRWRKQDIDTLLKDYIILTFKLHDTIRKLKSPPKL